MDEEKHICKLCSKVFPCGRSLGGHMRSHLMISTDDHHKQRIRSRRQPNRPLHRKGAADSFLEGNLCKECGKSFHSLKALFGHMKCHSLNKEGSNSYSDEPPKRKRKRKRKRSCTVKKDVDVDSSSSLIISEIEQQEVALSLIILSMDKPGEKHALSATCNEPAEVSSNTMIKHDQQVENQTKFTCSICCKGFSSYQALGGHRASHKKFKGCCTPPKGPTKNTSESVDQTKDHECPICFKVFSSGQALGGHKRSHLVKSSPSEAAQLPIPRFFDLNLPAPPDDEDCSDIKPWWITNLFS